MHALELEQALDAGVRAGVRWCRAVQGRDVFGAGLLDTAVSPPLAGVPPHLPSHSLMKESLEGAWRVCHSHGYSAHTHVHACKQMRRRRAWQVMATASGIVNGGRGVLR